MRKDGGIEADEFTGMFAQTNNPRLRIGTQPKQLELF
jgi:hypothetical protein